MQSSWYEFRIVNRHETADLSIRKEDGTFSAAIDFGPYSKAEDNLLACVGDVSGIKPIWYLGDNYDRRTFSLLLSSDELNSLGFSEGKRYGHGAVTPSTKDDVR